MRKIYARVQREPWLITGHKSYHNSLAWQGGEKWEELKGIAAFPVEDLWWEECKKEGMSFEESRDALLYAIMQEDTVLLAKGQMAKNISPDIEPIDGEYYFDTEDALQNRFYVLFFFGEKIGELPDGVVVQPVYPNKEELALLKEHDFDVREDRVLAIYKPKPIIIL